MKRHTCRLPVFGMTMAIAAALLASVVGPAYAANGIPFGVSVLVIELTDNDIQLNAFVDGEWKQLKILDPQGRRIFDGLAKGGLKSQGGLSEMFWASEPTHYLEGEPNFDGTMESFLSRFPEGLYRLKGRTVDGKRSRARRCYRTCCQLCPRFSHRCRPRTIRRS